MFAPQTLARLVTFLSERELTMGHFWLIDQIGKCAPMPPAMLVARSKEEARQAEPEVTTSHLELNRWADYLEDLIRRDLLQIITEESLSQIREFLRQDPECAGPTDRLPDLGDVDFTTRGAEFYDELGRNVFGSTTAELLCSTVAVNGRPEQIYATTREFAAEGYFDNFVAQGHRVIRVGEIVKIGPWRSRWWLRHAHGWRLNVLVCTCEEEAEEEDHTGKETSPDK